MNNCTTLSILLHTTGNVGLIYSLLRFCKLSTSTIMSMSANSSTRTSKPKGKSAKPLKRKKVEEKILPEFSENQLDNKSPKTSKFSVPLRENNGVFIFQDHPEFKPNLSPKEVLQAGSFGGTYYRPIKSGVTKESYGPEVWEELPKDWLKGLNIKKQVASPNYDVNVNKYKVKCGGSLEMWESSNWIKAQDPYGWFQWYCRFFLGRRSDDDKRQISRWLRCAGETGRWRNNLIGKIFRAHGHYNDKSISPVVRQVLLHWAYVLTEPDYKKRAAKLKT